jgi:arylformamidase
MSFLDLAGGIDLTQTVEEGMTTYIGDPTPEVRRIKNLRKDGVNLSLVRMGSHTGTHVDAPLHFVSGGKSVEELPHDAYCGEAIALDLSRKRKGSGIDEADLKPFSRALRSGIIVLLYTGMSQHWGEEWARTNFTHLNESGAKFLVIKGVKAVGIDYLSIEEYRSKTHPVHKTLLGKGVLIIESLNSRLQELCGERFLFVCLPLKLRGGDGAPARAVAYRYSEGRPNDSH